MNLAAIPQLVLLALAETLIFRLLGTILGQVPYSLALKALSFLHKFCPSLKA